MEQKIPFRKIFYKIFRHVADSVKLNYGLNYLLAAVLTFFIFNLGWDVAWQKFFLMHRAVFDAGFLPVFLGTFVPVLVPGWLYFSGRAFGKAQRQLVGLALGQAAILGFSVSTFIKLFTGRVPPIIFGSSNLVPGVFRFGFYRGGWFNGWPSSHTTTAFAMAMALIQLCPNNRVIKICAWAFALFIGLGVSTNIHWLSDAVAGALIGYAIGRSVGWDFKKFL